MIIIRMSGGLERQMFQYALYIKLLEMGREVKFDDISEPGDEKTMPIRLSVFGIEYPRATVEEINRYLDKDDRFKIKLKQLFVGRKANVYREKGFFDPEVLKLDDVYLEGKFMSQKYFEDVLPKVRDIYSFPPVESLSLPPKANENFLIYYDEIMNSDSVSIHIRRSDSRYNEELYANICTIEYYQGAISYILERYPDAKFYIFSNEPKWIKGVLKEILLGFVNKDMPNAEIRAFTDRFQIMEANDEYTSHLDMYLLSQCHHNILSNSSFSWWGAWMNDHKNKTVIAPSLWVNGTYSEDIYTPGMVLVNSKGRVEKKVK